MICERVRVADNVFFILGGATDTIGVAAFPAIITFHVATRFRLSPDFGATVLAIEVRLEDSAGHNILPIPFTPSIEFPAFPPGASEPERSVNLPLFIGGARITKPGTYALVVQHDKNELGRTFLTVVSDDE